MSDLQLSLLIIGACVIAGVYLYNVWQERQFRRRSEEAFGEVHDDVLLPDTAISAGTPAERLEPKLDAASAVEPAESAEPAIAAAAQTRVAATATSATAIPTSAAAKGSTLMTIDPVIDYVVEVELDAPQDGADLVEELMMLAADSGKPVQLAGYDAAAGEWRTSEMGGGKPYARLRFALQMTNRSGCIEAEQVAAFRAAVLQWAEKNGGTAKYLEIADAHALAVQLDRFCADVDIAIGVNVVTQNGTPFSGTKIRALAEAGGLKLEPDGVFYLKNDAGDVLYTLDNHEPTAFVPEKMKTTVTTGVTFLMDVPRVADAARKFDGMVNTARGFATTLGGTLVDDNRAALTDQAIDKIRRQLTGILARMEAGQIPAGGARALRLFS